MLGHHCQQTAFQPVSLPPPTPTPLARRAVGVKWYFPISDLALSFVEQREPDLCKQMFRNDLCWHLASKRVKVGLAISCFSCIEHLTWLTVIWRYTEKYLFDLHLQFLAQSSLNLWVISWVIELIGATTVTHNKPYLSLCQWGDSWRT